MKSEQLKAILTCFAEATAKAGDKAHAESLTNFANLLGRKPGLSLKDVAKRLSPIERSPSGRQSRHRRSAT